MDPQKVLLDYKKARAQLIESGVFKKRKSKWNDQMKANFPIYKEAILQKAKIEGKPEPDARQILKEVSQMVSKQRRIDLGVAQL